MRHPVPTPIDVWDVETFDPELRGDLDLYADVIEKFLTTSRRHWLEREASDHTRPYPENPYAGEFQWVSDHIGWLMAERTIRAWHYTRQTDREVEQLRRDGIRPSDMDFIRTRLSAQVSAGVLPQDVADRLLEDSPFQSDQRGSRSNKFWMVSHPHAVDDGGVELLVESWGGESIYFWQRDPQLQQLLKSIGRARILEIAVPFTSSTHASSAGSAVVAAYGRMLGCYSDSRAFDLYAHQCLPASSVLAIHHEGVPNYDAMARGYPLRYSFQEGT